MILLLLAAALQASVPDRQVLIVQAASPVRAPGELTGQMVCFIIGTRAEDALDAWDTANGSAIERLPFQEPDEMADALAVGKCAAAAVDAAELPPHVRVVATLAQASTGAISNTP